MRLRLAAIATACLLAGVAAGQAPVPTERPAEAQAEAAAAGRLFDLGLLDSDLPIEIEARELDVVTLADGGRQLTFRDEVRVRQGEVLLRSDRLEAWYPAGAHQPEKLLVHGRVQISQGDRRAACEEAVYLRSAQTLTCTGGAELVQGCDVVRGQAIELDLARDRVRVVGAASLRIQPKGSTPAAGCPEGD